MACGRQTASKRHDPDLTGLMFEKNVPAKPSQLRAGEPKELRVSVISQAKSPKVTLHWRRLGDGDFQQVAGTHFARQSYRVQLPAINEGTVEYYLEATLDDGARVVWPATAPSINQTAIVMPDMPSASTR